MQGLWNVERVFVTEFTQSYMPVMAMQEVLIVKEASVLWEKARERGEPFPMFTVNVGNPMQVGQISRK